MTKQTLICSADIWFLTIFFLYASVIHVLMFSMFYMPHHRYVVSIVTAHHIDIPHNPRTSAYAHSFLRAYNTLHITHKKKKKIPKMYASIWMISF